MFSLPGAETGSGKLAQEIDRMPRTIRTTLISVRDIVIAAGPFVLLTLMLLLAAYFALDPAPPKRVVLATGPADSAYAAFGQRYAAELKRYGIMGFLPGGIGKAIQS